MRNMASQVGTLSSDTQNGTRTHQNQNAAVNQDLSNMSINRSTVILNSIGSISTLKALHRSVSDPGPSCFPAAFSTLFPPSTPPSCSSAPSQSLLPTPRSRRKSAHMVLLDDDRSNEHTSREAGVKEDDCRARGKKRRRLHMLSKRSPRRHRPPSGSKDQELEGSVELCAFMRCRLPRHDAVHWVQCDVCNNWYHVDCLHVNPKKLLTDPDIDFHCGCG